MSVSKRLSRPFFEVDEITISASLLIGTSPITERIVPDNHRINSDKCKH
jgi:hypothetical protein